MNQARFGVLMASGLILGSIGACKQREGAALQSSNQAGQLSIKEAEDLANSLEKIPADESQATDEISAILSKFVADKYPVKENGERPNGLARRDAHPKAHGCVQAKVTVTDLPADLKQGAFAVPHVYDAWIRYSNGSNNIQPDKTGDGRGMAIKLLGVEGDKILESERDAKTQDIIMINYPQFFVANAADYVDFTKRTSDGNILGFFLSPLAGNLRVRELLIARGIQGQKVSNPLFSQYWTMTPYLFGGRAAKLSAKPCSVSHADQPMTSSNFLSENMAQTLSQGKACFELMAQFQADQEANPIEDPRIEWEENVAPMRKIATIDIFKQTFNSKEQMAFCENLSYTPWHALPAHRPLGGINRVRKKVYENISALRHRVNGVTRSEPTEMKSF